MDVRLGYYRVVNTYFTRFKIIFCNTYKLSANELSMPYSTIEHKSLSDKSIWVDSNKMPEIIEIEVEYVIKAISKVKLTYRAIRDKLCEDNIYVTMKTIGNLLICFWIRITALIQDQEQSKVWTHILSLCMRQQVIFQQVIDLVDNEKLAIYNCIQIIIGISFPTIFKIIHLSSSPWKKNKTKVHQLCQNSKKNQKAKCRKLY